MITTKQNKLTNEINTLENKIVLRTFETNKSTVPLEATNIAFFGKEKTGKTTATSVLCDPFFDNNLGSPSTKDTKVSSFVVHQVKDDFSVEQEERKKLLNIIDTPGLMYKESTLYDKTYQGQIHEDSSINMFILECLRQGITKIHCLFFVVPFGAHVFQSGYLVQHASLEKDIGTIEALLFVAAFFKAPICILITRAELKSIVERKLEEERVKKFICELQRFLKSDENSFCCERHLSNMQQSFEHETKILFIGALEDGVAKNGASKLCEEASNILSMRTEIFQYVFSNLEGISFEELDCCKQNEEISKKLIFVLNKETKRTMMILNKRKECIVSTLPKRLLIYLLSFLDHLPKSNNSTFSIEEKKGKRKREHK
jgi:hypothetical protein